MTRNRKPDVVVGENYLKRWHIIPENRFFNIYYHEIRTSDLDRHLHDHPYFFSSLILEGGYQEHTVDGVVSRRPGDFNFHSPWRLHKLIMNDENGANTIFITGMKMRKWGFQTENGWVSRDKYLEQYGIQGNVQQLVVPAMDGSVFEIEDEGNEKSMLYRIRRTFDGWMRRIFN